MHTYGTYLFAGACSSYLLDARLSPLAAWEKDAWEKDSRTRYRCP